MLYGRPYKEKLKKKRPRHRMVPRMSVASKHNIISKQYGTYFVLVDQSYFFVGWMIHVPLFLQDPFVALYAYTRDVTAQYYPNPNRNHTQSAKYRLRTPNQVEEKGNINHPPDFSLHSKNLVYFFVCIRRLNL